MRVLELTGFEGPASLRLGHREPVEPGPGEVRLRLEAMALNHLDVFVTRGLPKRPLPAILGSDGFGTIEAVGADVNDWHPGDTAVLYPVLVPRDDRPAWVGREVHHPKMTILGEHVDGTLQEQLTIPASLCYPPPPHLTAEEIAALPLAWLTAWRLLFTRGQLEAGDTLLVVGIGGGVATACLMLARARGLRVLVTSRDERKRARALDLGADVALPSNGFSAAVLEATGGQGVRAVVDTVGPATLDESFRSLAREGTLLTVGATSGPRAEVVLPRLWFRHLSLVTSTMGTSIEFRKMLDDVGRFRLRPPVDSVIPLADGADAFRLLESGDQFGKVVLRP